MDTRWRQLIDGLTYVKPECIDKEKIKKTLEYDRTYGEDVIDALYTMKVLDITDYIEYLSLIIARHQVEADSLLNHLEEAAKAGDKFDPMTHYGFSANFPEEISHKINADFLDKQNDV